jgi:hypothetical protein
MKEKIQEFLNSINRGELNNQERVVYDLIENAKVLLEYLTE